MRKKTVIVGITSGIAAYKSVDLVKALKKAGVDVVVIMTKQATKMISPSLFQKTSGHKVYTKLFEKGFNYQRVIKTRIVDHIQVTDRADLMIMAPATANVIGKLAYGIADDFLTTTALAITAPVILCPSMNVNMWHNSVVKGNVEKLKQAGYQIIEPGVGPLACGYDGKGRLPDIDLIKNEILKQLNRTQSLEGVKVLVTAGGTIEKIDAVRHIANRSSGKMGAAIAEACYLRGAEVLLLKARGAVSPRYPINEEIFSTAEELLELIQKKAKRYDVVYQTAAVSDFKVENPLKSKLKSTKSVTIHLIPRKKISNSIKKLNQNTTLILFKAEYKSEIKRLIQAGKKKLIESGAAAVVVNSIKNANIGFESDNNEVQVISDTEVKKIKRSSKRDIAEKIVAYVHEELLPLRKELK